MNRTPTLSLRPMHSTTHTQLYRWRSHPKPLRQKPDWAFSLRWALATCLAGTLSWMLSYALTFILIMSKDHTTKEAQQLEASGMTFLSNIIVVFLFMSVSFGLFIAIAQALVLQKRRGWAGIMNRGWLGSCALGYLFALLIPFGSQAIMLTFGDINLWPAFVGAGITSLMLSGIQWLSLSHHVRGGDMWMFATALSIALAWTVSNLLLLTLIRKDLGRVSFFDWGYIGVVTLVISMSLLVYGLVTGVALNKMERDTASQEHALLFNSRNRPQRPIRSRR